MSDELRVNATVLAYVSPQITEAQAKAERWLIVGGILRLDDGRIYGWRYGHVYRDFTTPDKLAPGCRVSCQVDSADPGFATRVSWHLVKAEP